MLKKREDVESGCVVNDQFGHWIKAGGRKTDWIGNRKEGSGKKSVAQLVVRGVKGKEIEFR